MENLQDKQILITGGSSGIGFQTAVSLAKMGASMWITGRDAKAGVAAATAIQQTSGNSRITFVQADLSTLAGMRALAGSVIAQLPRLDVLINNAGTIAQQRTLTEDGIELNFAVNVLAPFVLTTRLFGLLEQSQPARVITLMGGDIPKQLDLDNLQGERSFSSFHNYSASKVAMLTLMSELAARQGGNGVDINVCYPGQAITKMVTGLTSEALPAPLGFFLPLIKLAGRFDGGRSAQRASRSSVYLASDPGVRGINGEYFDTDCHRVAPAPASIDPANRAHLWQLATRLAGQ